jgi:hypothetical protein
MSFRKSKAEEPFMVGSQTVSRLASGMNEAAGSSVSSFARVQLEKFGWKECVESRCRLKACVPCHGTCYLQGHGAWEGAAGERETHCGVSQGRQQGRECSSSSSLAGIATVYLQIGFRENGDWNDQWWWGKGYGHVKVRVRSDSNVSGTSAVSSDDSDEEDSAAPVAASSSSAAPTDDELFRLCGGRRLGMRARGSQRGKWERAEASVTAAVKDLGVVVGGDDKMKLFAKAAAGKPSSGSRKRPRELVRELGVPEVKLLVAMEKAALRVGTVGAGDHLVDVMDEPSSEEDSPAKRPALASEPIAPSDPSSSGKKKKSHKSSGRKSKDEKRHK